MKLTQSAVIGLFLAALSVAFIIGTPKYIHVISAYENEASPRYFPCLVAGVLLVLSLALAFRNMFGKGDPDKVASITRPEVRSVAIVFAILAGGIVSMPSIGFSVATTATLIVLSLFLGVRNIRILIGLAVFWPLMVHVVFVKIFMISFPEWRLF